jgi:hypothetical protein
MSELRLAEVISSTPAPATPSIVDTVVEAVLKRGVSGASRENFPSVLAHACHAIEALPFDAAFDGAAKKQAALDVLRRLMVQGGASDADATSLQGAASACIDALVGAAKGEFRLQTPKDCWASIRRLLKSYVK